MLNFYNVFLSLCNDKGITPSRAALDCGISKVSVSNWKHKRNNPTDATLLKLANYFKVSVEYLKGEETDQKEKPAYEGGLTDKKKALIDFVKSVPDDKVDLILKVMKSIVEAD